MAATGPRTPRTHVDVGGGTGAAVWAARAAFPTLAGTVVLDQSLRLGERIAAGALAGVRWTQFAVGGRIPTADLITISYVLAELPTTAQADLVRAAAASARECPLTADDWCHFIARVNRSASHRRVKAGTLGHEDEKFSYVATTRVPVGAPARILGHPRLRKGLPTLRVRGPDGVRPALVSQRHGDLYPAFGAGCSVQPICIRRVAIVQP
ncbi:small ribosomal subunit Rsm22 family protein [Longispora sp. NPDC051575]|uniref:small ribosomal subunit Rsm22 family protein n=1 Tax=Longispora sp. NPDC051575 TaxID=3154943 RepID=UPI0034127230